MSDFRLYLTVPFAEKDDAKKLGARWDPSPVRRWYITPSQNRWNFSRWLPHDARLTRADSSQVTTWGMSSLKNEIRRQKIVKCVSCGASFTRTDWRQSLCYKCSQS